MRFILVLVVFGGCGLAESDVPGDDDLGPDEPLPACANLDTILAPPNEATVPTTMSVHIRWNVSNVPDRRVSLNDDAGTPYAATSSQVLMDGSMVFNYELPPGGYFGFEMRWACHTGGGPVPLRSNIRFRTQPSSLTSLRIDRLRRENTGRR